MNGHSRRVVSSETKKDAVGCNTFLCLGLENQVPGGTTEQALTLVGVTETSENQIPNNTGKPRKHTSGH